MIMAQFYKRDPADWMMGTNSLTLEQEAAYCRIVDTIHLYDQPVTLDYRVLAGLWRCNERKAKRLLQELIDAGKVSVDSGLIINRRAVEEASTRRGRRMHGQSTSNTRQVEQQNIPSNPLKTNEPNEKPPRVREEKKREENIEFSDGVSGEGELFPDEPPRKPDPGPDLDEEFRQWYAIYPRKVGVGQAEPAYRKARKVVSAETLLASVRRFAGQCEGKEPQFIAHPSTWLNGRRWADEDATQPAANSTDDKRAFALFAWLRYGPDGPNGPLRSGPEDPGFWDGPGAPPASIAAACGEYRKLKGTSLTPPWEQHRSAAE
jgi:uncharacterized protein YdaU (DUF1376 family)